jgi:hypothetical protein
VGIMTRPTRLRRLGRASAVAACVTFLAALLGCTPHADPTPTRTAMDASQAHDEVDSLLNQAQQAVGGTWRSIDGGAEICKAAGGPGAQFPFGRLGPGVPVDQQSAIIATVTAAWKTAGFTPVELAPHEENGHTVRQLDYPASGYGEDGIYLSLSITTLGSSLDAQSRCIPGDADKINEERQK